MSEPLPSPDSDRKPAPEPAPQAYVTVHRTAGVSDHVVRVAEARIRESYPDNRVDLHLTEIQPVRWLAVVTSAIRAGEDAYDVHGPYLTPADADAANPGAWLLRVEGT